MSQTFRQETHEPVSFVAPSGGVVNEVPVVIDGWVVIPEATVAADKTFAGRITGVHRVPKATGFIGLRGSLAFQDFGADARLEATGTPIGRYLETAGSSDDTGLIVLTPELNALGVATPVKQLIADGTQKQMSVSDTYVNFTEDAISLPANTFADNDTVEWELEAKLDAMNAAMLVTLDLLLGALSIDTVAISTGDTGDWAKLKGTARCTAVGGSSTWDVFGGEGCNSDGGSVTRDTPTLLAAQSGPATTSPVVFTPRAKAATGNAGNLITIRNFKIKHHKAA